MNGSGILRWDADAVPLEAIDMEVSWDVNIDCEINSLFIGADEYSLRWTIVGSGTVTASFTREALDPDDPTSVTANNFAIASGETPVGDPSGSTPPFFRSVFANVYPKNNTPGDGPLLEDDTNTWSLDWTETYTPIGGSPPGPDDSGTETGEMLLALQLNQNGNQIGWTVIAALVDALTGAAFPQGALEFNIGATGSETIGPWTVTAHDLKKAGDVDIGGTGSLGYTAPTNWDTNHTWNFTIDYTVACS